MILNTKGKEFLTHHGVKGMKCGVRKDQHREYQDKATKSTDTIVGRITARVNLARNTTRGAKRKAAQKFDDKWCDAGIWSRKPTILLSPKQTLSVSSVKQLTGDDINRAQRAVLKNHKINDRYANRSK